MELEPKLEETVLFSVLNPRQVDKNSLMQRDTPQTTNISQASENNDEGSINGGCLKTESGGNEAESNKIIVKGNNSKKTQVSRKWEWHTCNYELKREEKETGTEIYWILTPIIQLINPESKSAPQIDISVNMDRLFMYNSEVGWNWHKSWNLPNITISMKIIDPKTKIPVLPPAELKAQIFAVKVLPNRVEQVKLFDLGLKGSKILDISDGSCTFSGIKFSSTSYNNDGVKFHLVLLVYIQDDIRNRACPKILYSRISPPIFVDSRKAARHSHIIRKTKINSVYFASFPTDSFTRQFVKRNNKICDSKEEAIENSLYGLGHYFTAPNIRNKVKHPLFLAYKFSHCLKLFYNTDLVKQLSENEELSAGDLIYIMQKSFLEDYNNRKEKGEFNTIPNRAFDNKCFILVAEEAENPESSALAKKIADYLEPIINDVLHVIFNSNLLPSNFVPFPMDDLVASYTAVYPKLLDLKECYDAPFDEDMEEFDYLKGSPDSHRHNENDINAKRERFEDMSELDLESDDMNEASLKDEESSRANVGMTTSKKIKTDKKTAKTIPKGKSRENTKSKAPIAPKKQQEEKIKPKRGKKEAKGIKKELKEEPMQQGIQKMEQENTPAEIEFDGLLIEEGAPVVNKKEEEEVKEPVVKTRENQGNVKIEKAEKVEDQFQNNAIKCDEVREQPNMEFFSVGQQKQPRQSSQPNHLFMMMYQDFMKNPNLKKNSLPVQQQQQHQHQQHQSTPAPAPLAMPISASPMVANNAQTQQLTTQEQREQFLQMQIIRQQQQLVELQNKLKDMQEKVNKSKKDKKDKKDKKSPEEKVAKKPEPETPSGNGGGLSGNMMMNQPFFNPMFMGNPPYPGFMPGVMMNRPFGMTIQENFAGNPFAGIQMPGQEGNKAPSNLPFPNLSKDDKQGKRQ